MRLLIESEDGRVAENRKRDSKGEQGKENRLRRATRQRSHRGRNEFVNTLQLRAVLLIHRCSRFMGCQRTLIMGVVVACIGHRIRMLRIGR